MTGMIPTPRGSYQTLPETGDTYESGLRDLSADTHKDQEWDPDRGPTVRVERYGPLVELTVESLARVDGNGEGNFSVIDLPTGFRPKAAKYPTTWRGAMGYVHPGGLVRVTNPFGSLDYFSLTFMTDDPAPPAPLSTGRTEP